MRVLERGRSVAAVSNQSRSQFSAEPATRVRLQGASIPCQRNGNGKQGSLARQRALRDPRTFLRRPLVGLRRRKVPGEVNAPGVARRSVSDARSTHAAPPSRPLPVDFRAPRPGRCRVTKYSRPEEYSAWDLTKAPLARVPSAAARRLSGTSLYISRITSIPLGGKPRRDTRQSGGIGRVEPEIEPDFTVGERASNAR